MKIDPPMWIAADFEGMNMSAGNANCRQSIPAETNNDDFMDNLFINNLFINKPLAKGYNIIKKLIL